MQARLNGIPNEQGSCTLCNLEKGKMYAAFSLFLLFKLRSIPQN
uniref:Uncharacterized protein n=1 Tax=Rhizophora mucronata TaxID=61149 RepID=A0A2P2PT52_RHIMU